jgi:hypothetical protein
VLLYWFYEIKYYFTNWLTIVIFIKSQLNSSSFSCRAMESLFL